MTERITSGLRALMKEHILAIVILVAVVLVGYYKVFGGGHVFLHEDHVAISNYSYGNSLGNGWRPDKGFGISAFMGDGIWHPWSPFSLWERFIRSRTVAYNSSVILLGILASIAQYFFLRKILPKPHYWIAVLLSPLVLFGTDQAGNYFLRLSASLLIAMPWFLILLSEYFVRPSVFHILLAGLIFALVVAFGNMWSLTVLLSLGFFFMLARCIYYRGQTTAHIRRFVLLYGAGCVLFVFLSAWFIYSLFYESTMVGYMREKVNADFSNINHSLNLEGIINYVLGIVFAEWLPVDHNIAGVGYKPFLYSYNVNAVFPLIFVFFLFRKREAFWEYSLKFLLLIFLIHNFLQRANVFGYGELYSFINNQTSKIITMYDFVFPLEIGLMAIFISDLNEKNILIVQRWGRRLQQAVAGILFFFYLALLGAGLLAFYCPDALVHLVQWLIRDVLLKMTHRFSYELLDAVATYNIKRFAEVMHGYALLYYLSSAVLVAFFLKDSWLKYAARLPKNRICVFLLANALLMSWTVYPLSTKKMAWEGLEGMFSPTDRFYYVLDSKSKQTLENFKGKYSELEGGGHRERNVGLLEPPGFNLSGLKSFETKKVGEFIYNIFNGDGSGRLTNLRLYYGGPPIFNELLDMSAVKYYYSDFALKDLPPYVTLFFHKKQLYVYKNDKAWPYFYLAQHVDLKKENEHLSNVRQGTAYLEQKDMFPLSAGAGKVPVDLKEFSYGKMIFDYKSKNEEFLVVADTWHPFWKAEVEGQSLPVIKANEVFKGVRLPPGHHELMLYFDTAPYKPGIYISLVSWIVFIIGFFWAVRTKSELRV